MRVAKPVLLSPEDDRCLRDLSKRKRVEVRVQLRARIVLLAAQGWPDKDIADKLDIERRVAARWRARFLEVGVAGLLKDATRPGRPRTARETATVQEVVRVTLNETPQGATHWSTRTLAKHLGTNATAVARIWRDHGLKPHRVKTFKLSNDPRFVEKLEDIVGLYMNPPEHALVLSCDEKTQIQAFEARARRHDDPRLQAQRRDHAVRRTQCANRQSPVHDGPASPSPGMVAVSQDHRSQHTQDQAATPHR